MYVKVIVPVHKPAETYELFLMAPPDRSFKKTVSHPPVHDKERGEMYFIVDAPFFPLWGGVNAVYKTGERRRRISGQPGKRSKAVEKKSSKGVI